jgi:hypothetical protein
MMKSFAALSLVLLIGCSKPEKVSVEEHLKTTGVPGGLATQASLGITPGTPQAGAAADGASHTVVARYEGGTLTDADVREWIAHLNEVDRIRYQSTDKKRELVKEIVAMELLAREALEQGYGEREDLRLLLKIEVARRFLEDRVQQSVTLKDISEEDVTAYYAAHRAAFIRGETRQVSRIVVASEALARQVRAELDASLVGASPDARVALFKKARRRYTEETGGKEDKGVVGWIDATGIVRGIVERKRVCRDVARAAFDLPGEGTGEGAGEGSVAGPIACDGQQVILFVDGRRPPVQMDRAQVASRIKNTLLQERKEAAKAALIKDLVSASKIQIHDEGLKAFAKPAPPAAAERPSPRFRPPSLLRQGASLKGMKPIRAEASRSFERMSPERRKALLDEQADKALK